MPGTIESGMWGREAGKRKIGAAGAQRKGSAFTPIPDRINVAKCIPMRGYTLQKATWRGVRFAVVGAALFAVVRSALAAGPDTCDPYVAQAVAAAAEVRQLDCGFDLTHPQWSPWPRWAGKSTLGAVFAASANSSPATRSVCASAQSTQRQRHLSSHCEIFVT
jgi:hypothetical protein